MGDFAIPPGEATATKPAPEEQRATQRATLLVQVEFKTARDYTLGHSQDISEGGLLVVTPETVEPRSEVVVRFNLPPYTPGVFIESQGVVARVLWGECMGIQFLQLTDAQRKAIATFVQQVLERDT